MKPFLLTLAFALVLGTTALTTRADTVRVFVLAGQSNMQGQGAVGTLAWLGEDPVHGKLLDQISDETGAWKEREDVWVYYPRSKDAPDTKQGPLTVGFGARNDKIGPELFFGQVVGDHFEDPVLLIKTCWGGRALATEFRPPSSGGDTGAAYLQMLDIVEDTLTNFEERFPHWSGATPELTGFVWFQGWNDMIDPQRVSEYEVNLVNLIRDLRQAWQSTRLPVVVGTLGVGGPEEASKNERMRTIRLAQSAPASQAEFTNTVATVATEELWDHIAYELLQKDWLKDRRWDDPELKAQFDRMGNQPPYHYMGNAKVFALIGQAFGEAMVTLLESAIPKNVSTGIDRFDIHPAFQIERVASEPILEDPVDLQFDEHGTAYVVEMGGYPFSAEDPEHYPGKVVVIQDTDADGIYDERIVFADQFQYADSILPHRGGILVASPPDIIFLKDTDGDLRADVRKVLISGFSVGNSQHNVNGLIHGLDNWIYAGNGGNGGELFWPDRPDQRLPMRRSDVKFDFERQRLSLFGPTTTGFSVALDDYNRVFTTHNLKHINHLVFPARYAERDPYLTPRGNPDISDHKTGNLDRAYPIGKQDARLNHPEQSGYFSCSCGITFYGGGAFPTEFNGNLFVADSVMNLIHRDILRPDGPGFLAARGRPKAEFLATADRHSRPVNMRVGPDGALYVIDMYRVVIEHPEWIPDDLEKDMDLYAGTNQGRIYRITPKGGLPQVQPHFDRDNLTDVVSALDHPNKWWRDTAQRLLVWWDDSRSVEPLKKLYLRTIRPQTRAHILWTLQGLTPQSEAAPSLGALTESILQLALQDAEPGVRENALMLSETGLSQAPGRLTHILALAEDPHARVRMQATLTLGELAHDASVTPDPAQAEAIQEALLTILHQDVQHPWSRFAILTALGEGALPFFVACLPQAQETHRSEAHQAFLTELAELIATHRRPEQVVGALEALTTGGTPSTGLSLAVLSGLNRGLAKGGQLDLPRLLRERVSTATQRFPEANVALLSELWRLKRTLRLPLNTDQQAILSQSHNAVLDRELPLTDRLAYLRLLEFADFESREDLLWSLLGFQHAQEIQLAALRQLTGQRSPEIASGLIERWSSLSRACRTLASDHLIYRSANHDILLTALEEERLRMGQLNLDLERRRRLLWSDDPKVKQRAEALFSDSGVVTRAQVLAQLKPALQLTGTPERGRLHYTNLCTQCHTIGSAGYAVGPDLTEIFRKGAETLLSDLFDPNAAVNTEYIGFTIDDDEGEVYSGIVTAETEAWVTLREAGGRDVVIPRHRIESMISSGLSLMPEALEFGLTHQDVADLLAFLQQPK